ncbi:N-acetylmuramoyl-L-alanine amidase [Melghirimyces profundicolus]|nr:N-acetylmuramoyl-L-alanine amidase [Melghirimyces profundicolus]
MEKTIHHRSKSDFAKGKGKNLDIQSSGNKALLSMKTDGEEAEYTSPVIQSDMVFTDVGLHWTNTAKAAKNPHYHSAQFSLRTSKDGEKWTEWKEVHVSHQGPEHKQSEETLGDLVYGDHGKFIQYKITMKAHKGVKPRIRDIKLFLLNSEDGTKVEAKGKMTLAGFLSERAQAAIDRPNIVSRAEWGADESLRYVDGKEDWPREYDDHVNHLVFHHTDTPNDDPDPAARVRSIYYYHAKVNEWGDIGYNAVIGSDGKIYEGRKGKDGDVLTPGVVGAHAYGFNHYSFGVSMMGTYTDAQLPDHMHNALIDLLSYQADLHGIDPLGSTDYVRNYEYDESTGIPKEDPDVPNILDHRRVPRASTSCPGDMLDAEYERIRQEVADRLAAADGSTITLDNSDPDNVADGDWVTSTNVSGYYGSNYQANDSGWGIAPDTFTWNFNLPAAGKYRVYAYYTAAFDRATDAPYEIHTKNGVVTKEVNQQVNGSSWVELGTYEFNSGANKVVQTDDADGYVIADGLRLEKVEDAPEAQPATAIVDNTDSQYTTSSGSWPTSTNAPGYYGSNYQPNAAGSGGDTFTWKFTPPETGSYKVSVYYAAASDRASNAPFTILHGDGTATRRVDQRTNGGQWVDLGTYHFTQGTTGKVTLTDDADGYVIADAVKFERTSDVLISDNADSENEGIGTWKTSTNLKHYGSNYQYDYKGTGDHTFTWNLKIPETGTYRVYAQYQAYTDRASNAPYTIHHQSGTSTVKVDQRVNGSQWVDLGTYNFEQGTGSKVILSDNADGIVVADAIKLERVEQNTVISDNGDPGNEGIGAWKSSNNVAGFEGDDYQYDYKGTGDHTFTWNLNIPKAGYYKVYAKYMAYTDRATNAPYTIYHQDGQTVQRVNQRKNGSQWVELGTFRFEAGTGSKIVLSDKADGIVVADSVKLEPAPVTVTGDNTDSNVDSVGTWKTSNNISGYTGTSYQYNGPNNPGEGAWFAWNLNIPEAGSYDVYVKYMAYKDRASNAPYTIHHRDGQTTRRVDQRTGGSQWVYIGTYNFDQGTSKIVLSDDADGFVIADSVKLEKAPTTITSDNADTGNEGIGAWKVSNNISGYEGTNYQYDYKGTGDHTFTWNFDVKEAGSYKVYAKYMSYTDRATNAPYTIHHKDGQTTKRVDQRTGGSQWVYIGTYNFDTGTGKVVLSDDADGIVVADAIRLIKE